MVDNRIGIEVAAKATGNEALREQIQSLSQLNAGWAQFNDLRRDAAEAYPDDLKKQNTHIQQQLSLLQKLENVGSRDRLKTLQDERSLLRERYSGRRMGTQAREEIAGINARIRREERDHIEWRGHAAEATGHRMQWAMDRGIGEPSQADLLTDLTGMGIRGAGPSGMARMGLGRLARGVTARMAGMGTLAKLGVGTGAGALAFGAYKFVTGALEGKEAYKQIAPDLMQIQAMTGRLASDATAFREEFEAVAIVTGTTLKEMSALEQSYIRITGGGAKRSVLDNVINIAQSFGIERGAGVEFAARMGMTGYAAGPASDQRLKEAIIAGVRSGIGMGRLPEFLQGIMGLTDAVMRTSVTDDPALMGRYAGRMGVMGVPFRGLRGIQQLTGFNQAITQGGMGFQAARRVLERGGGNFSFADVEALREQGLQDPRLIEEYFALAGQFAPGDLQTQAWWLKKQTGIPMRAFYNPDEGINSSLELQRATGGRMRIGDKDFDFAAATADIEMSAETRRTMKEMATDPEFFSKRVKEMMGTTGFEVQMRAVATEIGKIETAADTFERANEIFLKGALAIAGVGIGSAAGSEIMDELRELLRRSPVIIYEAAQRRRDEAMPGGQRVRPGIHQ